MNTDLVRRIQANAAAHARYQALTEAARIAKKDCAMTSFTPRYSYGADVTKAILALRDAKET